MSKLVAVAAFAAIAAAFVVVVGSRSEANASGAGDPRIAVLQKQVKTLQTEVKVLTADAVEMHGQVHVGFTAETCLAAQTADLLQGTWEVVDQIAQATQQKTYFGAQTQVNDYGNCAQLQQPTVPRSPVAAPPTINSLLPIMQWLHE
jgi:hypothetical protein